MASRWAKRIVLFLAVGLVASGLCYVCLRVTTAQQYTGQIELIRRLPVDQARRDDPAGSLQVAVMTARSERVLQNTARALILYNITSTPEELLQSAKVEPVPGTDRIRLTITSRYRDQAEVAVGEMANEAQRIYLDAMNWEAQPSQRNNGFQLVAAGPARAFHTPSQAPMSTLLFAAIFTAALLVLVIGVSAGRSSGQTARWPRAATLASVALLLVSAGVLAYALRAPRLYCGRVKMVQRLAPKDVRPGSLQRLDNWLGRSLRSDVAAQTARTLALFNITMSSGKALRAETKSERNAEHGPAPISPDAVTRATKVERIPDTPIVMIEVTSPKPDLAEVTADVVASETQRAYRDSTGVADQDQRTGRASRLRIIEEAHVFPVRTVPQKAGTVGLITAAASLIFLISSGAGRLLRR